MRDSLGRVAREVVACERCPRLRAHCREVARVKRRAYRDQTYWGRPVPGFGDPEARLLVVGLAPAAHGGNRTGRIFTGDRSGDFLFASFHRLGLASQPTSVSRDDGLELRDVYVSAAARCAPPANLPTRDEMDRCAGYLRREIALLGRMRAAVALGSIAWDALLRQAAAADPAAIPHPRPRFGHAATAHVRLRPGEPPCALVGAYHPSQQNTQTGRLAPAMLDAALGLALELARKPARTGAGGRE